MKAIKPVIMLSMGATALLFQLAAMATDPSASGRGVVVVHGNAAGNFSIGANGAATSYAQQSESATARVTAATGFTPHHRAVTAGISGATTSDSSGQAYNISSGSGTGSATSAGSAATLVRGAAAIHGVTNGATGGEAATHTSNIIEAGRNQGSYVTGQTASGFATEIDYTRVTATAPATTGYSGGQVSSQVGVATRNSGYASGSNASGALESMNAAGLANIGASGRFFANGSLSASTGTVAAP